jgi:hypothetical protein
MNMNNIGSIKICEDRIITTKDNSIDIWTRFGNGDDSRFIIYNGNRYKLLKSKDSELIQDDDEIDD